MKTIGNYKYGRYVNSNQETRWATTEEIQKSGTYVDLFADKYPVGGIPLLSNGKEAYLDGEDTHTLIFGATGSKKTRLFCMPTINFFIKAGESFVATDPKGEIYARTSGMAKENGYDIVVLNFREIGKGDMWNPFAIPYELYKSGDKESATAMLNDFMETVSAPLKANTKDLFWPEMAQSLGLAHLLLLMESAKPEEINVASLASMSGTGNEDYLKDIAELMQQDCIAAINYNGIFSGANATKQSVYATLFGLVRIFNTQKNLARMLSGNTVDIRSFGKKKTAVYIIVPDEKTTYHFLITSFVKQVYEMMISEAQKMPHFRLPVRVNFMLDEFCNLPKFSDMPSMISASRSRNMRFFLVAQSLHQLRGKYGEDADTIKGNCDNWIFLTSKELDLLNEISDLCGSVYTENNVSRKLISVSELQRLDKQKGESLIMHARQYPIITEIADIDDYQMFKGYEIASMKPFDLPKVSVISVSELLEKIKNAEIPIPFGTSSDDEEPRFYNSEEHKGFFDDI